MKDHKFYPKEETTQANLQPREKLATLGADKLTNAELLALVFITGTRNESVLELSARCLKEYGSRSITNIRNLDQAREILNLGNAKACQLIAIFELGRRFFKETNTRMPIIRGPEDVYKLYSWMQNLKREELRALYLNTRQRLVHEEIISIGNFDQINVFIPSIIQPAIEMMTKNIILVHNHPSGQTSPSIQDIECTKHIIKAAKLMDLNILDHIIIGRDFRSILQDINN